jgi:electron transfer flavoprotein alpha subunit
MASDISKLAAANQLVRPILAGNAYSTVQVDTPVIVVMVRQAESAGRAARFLGRSPPRRRVRSMRAARRSCASSRRERSPELSDAKIVVGRPRRRRRELLVLEQLADPSAPRWASRAATDAGMVPADWQVGQTGKIVAPDLYSRSRSPRDPAPRRHEGAPRRSAITKDPRRDLPGRRLRRRHDLGEAIPELISEGS